MWAKQAIIMLTALLVMYESLLFGGTQDREHENKLFTKLKFKRST